MGITGLLPFLQKATRDCHVSEFRGGSVAIDSYCLLHKGATICVEQLARGEDTQLYVNYCMKYVKMLLSYDIHPIMVFDGRNLPAKADTEAKRRESRRNAKRKAAELLVLGKQKEAQTYLRQCVDITPKMAHNLIKECRKLNVDCIVAPYESDAQLSFFSQKGIAECIITEDSDLLVFGCHKVLFKMDVYGAGRLVEADKIPLSMTLRPDQYSFDKFRFMCILSGCDYANSLSGVGLKKAEKFLKLTAEENPEIFLNKIPRYLNLKNLVITDEYKNKFLLANATFLHQVVFDPYNKKLVHLKDPAVIGTDPKYLESSGDKYDDEKAYQVAIGNLDPYSYEQFDNWVPENLPHYSIWSGVYKKRISRKQEKQIQKQSFQDYFTTATISTETVKVDEQLVIEEEEQIQKDLSIYTTKLEIIEETPTETKIVEVEDSKEETSPILKRNPFLRKKRMSKFKETYQIGNTVVRSRFFGQSKEAQQIDDFVTVPPTKTTLHEIGNVSLLDPNGSPTGTAEILNKKRTIDEVEEDIDINTVQSISEECVENIEKSTVATEVVQSSIKIRKLGLRKLNKITKTSKHQPTLHGFFGKLRQQQ